MYIMMRESGCRGSSAIVGDGEDEERVESGVNAEVEEVVVEEVVVEEMV
jgi:hypothetical protein